MTSLYCFAGRDTDGFARIGNSVPPRMMQYIAEHIYTHILTQKAV